MTGNWPLAGRLPPLLVIAIVLATSVAHGGEPSCVRNDDETTRAADPLPAGGFSAGDLADEDPHVPVRRASLRKPARRIAPPRSVLRSSPDATVLSTSRAGFARQPVSDAVRVANTADLAWLCRRLL